MLYLHRIRRWFGDMARNIFHYHDGDRSRRADPFVISQLLDTKYPKYADLLLTLSEKDSEYPVGPMRDAFKVRQKEAVVELIKIARDVFELKPITDTGGCTDAEAVKTVTAFFLFMEGLAEQAGPFVN